MSTAITEVKNGNESAKEGIQLKKLPNLREVKKENPMRTLLSQSIALQLKTMKSGINISQLGFENLLQFIELQMEDMFQILHRFANIQRRNELSLHDINLFLAGTGIKVSDLQEEAHRCEYVKARFAAEVGHLASRSNELAQQWHKSMSDEELLSSKYAEFFFKDVDILNLVPPTNLNNRYVPKWLPEFPPDHTYKFTSIYNTPITDERLMKRKLFEEGNLSEIALLNMLGNNSKKKQFILDDEQATALYKQSQEETAFIYGFPTKRQRPKSASSSDKLPGPPASSAKAFNIEEYARSRVELARRQVEEFELRKLQPQKNPFIRAANVCSPYGNNQRISRKSMEREFNVLLQRSFVGVVKSIPHLKKLKEKELAAAIEREWTRKKEQKPEHGVVDLNVLDEDPILVGLDSSESEDENNADPAQPDENAEHDLLADNTYSSTANSELYPSNLHNTSLPPLATIDNEFQTSPATLGAASKDISSLPSTATIGNEQRSSLKNSQLSLLPQSDPNEDKEDHQDGSNDFPSF